MAGHIVIVLDTSALIFWTLDRERLSEAAMAAIADADRILVSSISIWEIGIKVSRGGLSIPQTVREFADRLIQVDRVELLPVDTATWLKNIKLEWSHYCRRCAATCLPTGYIRQGNPRILSRGNLVALSIPSPEPIVRKGTRSHLINNTGCANSSLDTLTANRFMLKTRSS